MQRAVFVCHSKHMLALCGQVKTLDGKTVYRRRHYRVRRAKQPGTFFFSVLDNGVISKEYWRVVHAAEDLSWALFYYAGAASVVGQAYRGDGDSCTSTHEGASFVSPFVVFLA